MHTRPGQKRIYNIIYFLFIAISLFSFSSLTSAQLAPRTLTNIQEKTQQVTGGAYQQNVQLETVAANTIVWVLSFLGVVATLVIAYGGFKWMTAGGNEEQVNKAKRLIINGIVGLIIIILAFAISWFVIRLYTEILIRPGGPQTRP